MPQVVWRLLGELALLIVVTIAVGLLSSHWWVYFLVGVLAGLAVYAIERRAAKRSRRATSSRPE